MQSPCSGSISSLSPPLAVPAEHPSSLSVPAAPVQVELGELVRAVEGAAGDARAVGLVHRELDRVAVVRDHPPLQRAG